jgi:hypothetical protein
MVGEHDHPVAGRVRYVASAVRFDDRAPPRGMRPPLLGEHTLDVLTQWLELAPAEVRAYAEAGAFGRCARSEASLCDGCSVSPKRSSGRCFVRP